MVFGVTRSLRHFAVLFAEHDAEPGGGPTWAPYSGSTSHARELASQNPEFVCLSSYPAGAGDVGGSSFGPLHMAQRLQHPVKHAQQHLCNSSTLA